MASDAPRHHISVSIGSWSRINCKMFHLSATHQNPFFLQGINDSHNHKQTTFSLLCPRDLSISREFLLASFPSIVNQKHWIFFFSSLVPSLALLLLFRRSTCSPCCRWVQERGSHSWKSPFAFSREVMERGCERLSSYLCNKVLISPTP